MISTTILIAHWLVVVGLSLRVITRRASVAVSVAWIAVMFSVPFIGAAAYLVLGEKRLGRRRTERTAANLPAMKRWQASLKPANQMVSTDSTAEPLPRLAESILGFPPMCGNDVELLEHFDAIFDALVDDIDRARERCDLSFYIWHEEGRAVDVVHALERAARRGVRCRGLGDAVGSKHFLRGELAAQLREAGVALHAALPTGFLPALFSRVDLRNHRKIVVIDGRVAYTGSQNLVDPRFFMQDAGVGEWIDAMARVTGPAAAALEGVFELDWSVEHRRPFALAGHQANAAAGSGATIQVIPSGPELRPEAIHELLLTAIYGARRELVMTTPYFVPDESMLTALLSAALRGVEVTLIVPASNNSLLVRYAGVAAFDDLLSAGVRIALFSGGLLHTKSLTIDQETSIFGSVNLDMRSLWLNAEISLFIYDSRFTLRLRSLQNDYLTRSEVLDLSTWRRRGHLRRLTENTFRLLGPLL